MVEHQELEFLNGSFPRINNQIPLDSTRLPDLPAISYQNSSEENKVYPLPPGFDIERYFTGPLPARKMENANPPQMSQQYHNPLNLNCIHVANHLVECPVCSRLHKSHSSVYMGIIIALLIVIVFLGRRFFD